MLSRKVGSFRVEVVFTSAGLGFATHFTPAPSASGRVSWYRTVAHQMFPFCPANSGPELFEYRSRTTWKLKKGFSTGRSTSLQMIHQSNPEPRARFGRYLRPMPQGPTCKKRWPPGV